MRSPLRWTVPVLALALALASPPDASSSPSWPGFRGPATTGAATEALTLTSGPGSLVVRWHAELGPGYSEVAVAEGIAATLHSDGSDDWLSAFDAASGDRRWRYRIGPTYKGHDGSHDGPIASPVIAGGRVVGLGPHGALFALDATSGAELWRIDLAKAHGAEPPFYGFSSSPLIVGGIVVAGLGAPGGKAMAGFDLTNGALRWTAGDDAIDYQSPIVFDVAGARHVVATGGKTIFGLDPANGKVLWSTPHEGSEAAMAAPSLVPVPAGEGRLFLKHSGDNSRMVRVLREGEAFRVETVWTAPVLRGTYAVPVYHQGLLFGYTGRIFSCVDAATGELVWRSREPGDGFLSLAGDVLVIRTKAGTLHLGRTSREGWSEITRFERDEVAWTAPSIAAGAVYVRGMNSLSRLEWKAGAAEAAAAVVSAGASGFDRFLAEVAAASDKKAAVDRFLAGIGEPPLYEWPDRAVFLFRGEARDVGLVSDLLGTRREEPLRRVEGTDLFYYDARLEPDARITYRFVRDFEQRVLDPLSSKKLVEDNGEEVSWFAMPSWSAAAFHAEPPAEHRGRLEEHEIESTLKPGVKIKLGVHLPAGYDVEGARRYPALYWLDGGTARRRGEMDRALDNLSAGSTEPAVAIFLEPIELGRVTTPAEFEEQTVLAARIVAEEVVAFVEGRYRTRPERSARAIAGASFHGYNAFETLIRHPRTFGAFAGQSVFLFASALPELAPRIPRASEHPFRLYLDWGAYDLRAVREGWDVGAANRALVEELRRHGYRPAGGERRDGHGWHAWKNRTDRLLAALFPRHR